MVTRGAAGLNFWAGPGASRGWGGRAQTFRPAPPTSPHCGQGRPALAGGSGGIDLLVGTEDMQGLRWPDLTLQHGRLDFAALRQALPRLDGLSVLSSVRPGNDVEPGALAAVIDAGRRGGVTVVCDLPRALSRSVEFAVGAADLVVLVTTADVGGCAAATAVAAALGALNPNVGLLGLGPSPAGVMSLGAGRHCD